MKNFATRVSKALVSFCLILVSSTPVLAANVDAEVQALTQQVDAIDSSIGELERSLLFPPMTRVSVYVSVSQDAAFDLQSLVLRMDGQEVDYHVYSKREAQALKLGGVQALWEGNVALGKHKLTASYSGLNVEGDPVSGNVSYSFTKSDEAGLLELQIVESDKGRQIDFVVQDRGEK